MSASLPYANTPRSAQPIEWAALTVAAEMASAGDIRMARQAKEMAVCMFNDGVSQGLKFVAMATAAPASINARAGAYWPLRKDAQGSSVAMVCEYASASTSAGPMCSRWSTLT